MYAVHHVHSLSSLLYTERCAKIASLGSLGVSIQTFAEHARAIAESTVHSCTWLKRGVCGQTVHGVG